jgi:hypothetical protein
MTEWLPPGAIGICCSWCHETAWKHEPQWPLCKTCGHNASLPRMFCDCPKCEPYPVVFLKDLSTVPCPYCGKFFPAEHIEVCAGSQWGPER